MENNNMIDLNKMKEYEYVEEMLRSLGIDEEQVKEYDKDLFRDDIRDILKEFFKERELVSDAIDEWVRENFKRLEDMTIFLSIIVENLQNLIVPDREHFMDLVFSFSEEADLEFEHWINVQSELEKFHLSSIKTYVKEMLLE